ncbi:alpha/beta fold hydrolase [Embleya sp. NBC_00896]|uniref:alpha/beta fold hydrolase n=1 Tax=Embleya sp. NBC_00896 TaxID=2975961 RepID=UPI00386AF59A|nr:alpha/beta hydrolase [Embleya sp. NBC_00896]
MDTGILTVPGADLYYEVRGAGPVLLFIPGGSGDAQMFAAVADHFSERHTVVTYDRRGNSRSLLSRPPVEQRIAEHADDALRLLSAFTSEPADVFGTSSGAAIALDLTARHPDRVNTVVAHEPLVVGLSPDPVRWRARFDEVYELYRREGGAAAMGELSALFGVAAPPTSVPAELPSWVSEMVERVIVNVDFGLAYELRSFTRYEPDLAALRDAPIALAAGAGGRETLLYGIAVRLAEQLDRRCVEFPGGHMGYAMVPDEFAVTLREVLDGKG